MNSDDLVKMTVEVATGKPRTFEGAEAERIYDQLEDECAEIREDGFDIEIPYELPDISD